MPTRLHLRAHETVVNDICGRGANSTRTGGASLRPTSCRSSQAIVCRARMGAAYVRIESYHRTLKLTCLQKSKLASGLTHGQV